MYRTPSGSFVGSNGGCTGVRNACDVHGGHTEAAVASCIAWGFATYGRMGIAIGGEGMDARAKTRTVVAWMRPACARGTRNSTSRGRKKTRERSDAFRSVSDQSEGRRP